MSIPITCDHRAPHEDPLRKLVERLRAEVTAFADPRYAAGRAAGRSWAVESANLQQFLQIHTARTLGTLGEPGGGLDPRALARLLGDGSPRDHREVLAEAGVVDPESADYCQGFAEAVVATWDQIRNQI